MRNNQPVTHSEAILPEGAFIYSRTDLKGVITEANKAFADISGFSQAEMIGQPHNLIRHPDMPAQAFADMWQNLKAGRPWKGVVKNRRKDGGFYWVVANASPVRENGRIVGYQSVRTRPSREQIAAAEAAYTRLREGSQAIRVQEGRVVPNRSAQVERLISHQSRLFGFALLTTLTGLISVASAGATSGFLHNTGICASVLSLLASLYMLLVYLPAAMRRMNNVLNFLNEVLNTGDLTKTLVPTKNDLIGAIASGADILVSSMRATLQIMDDATREVAETTSVLDQSVHEQTAAATAQSETTSNAAAGVEEMTVSINGVAEHAANTAQTANSTGNTAKTGADLSIKAKKTIETLSATVSRSAETVELLGERTTEIGKIAAVIKEIADQTNLLALNAAIEAARAGEQGRGFSVVADEVRKLAERTAGATREIEHMIHQINTDTDIAVASMRESAGQMEVSVTLVNNAHETLVTINTEMEHTVRMMNDISHSSAEQGSAMTAMSQGIERLARLTEDNLETARITEQSSVTVQANVERMRKAVALYRT